MEVGQTHTFATCSRWSGERERDTETERERQDVGGHWTKVLWKELGVKRDFLQLGVKSWEMWL